MMKAKVNRDGTNQECTKARGLQLSERGQGWEGSLKALDEARSLRLCSSSFFLLCISCIFIPKDERLRLCMNVKGTERDCFSSIIHSDGPLYDGKVAAVEIMIVING